MTTPSGNGIELTGKTAIVTGAASGIGAAVARSLATSGAAVAGLDVAGEGLRGVIAQIQTSGHRGAAFPVDVSDRAAVDDVVARVTQELGPVDLLVNVAGVLRMNAVESLTDDDWERSFAVNAQGVFHLCRAVAPGMIARRAGAIVTVGSNAARTPRINMAAYAASKAAATMFTRCLGLELAHHGIRCNVVSPGSTDTPMQRALWTDDHGPGRVIHGSLEAYRLGIPLRRIATPDDVAAAVLFLLSDRARHITLHDLCIDGGATLGA